MVFEKKKEPYSIVMAHVRSVISFSLVRSAIASLRGHRGPSKHFCDAGVSSAALAAAECHLPV